MKKCVILNAGMGSWAFQELAEDLAKNLDIEISDTPGDYNYVLACLAEAPLSVRWYESRDECHETNLKI